MTALSCLGVGSPVIDPLPPSYTLGAVDAAAFVASTVAYSTPLCSVPEHWQDEDHLKAMDKCLGRNNFY
jgi:hypothetical protein